MRCEETDQHKSEEPRQGQANIGGGQCLRYICVYISRPEWSRKSVLAEFVGHAGDYSDGQGNAGRSNAGLSIVQVYGLPPFQTAILTADGDLKYSATLDIANHADFGETLGESVVMDGESYFLTFSLRHGVTRWLEIGFDLPLVAHSSGLFDNAIESWHELLGISNGNRSGASNRLRFLYASHRTEPYELTSSAYGIGDMQLTIAAPLWAVSDTGGRAMALRSSVKLPTGDEETLLGSGAIDYSLGLYASDAETLAKYNVDLTAFAGILLLGEGRVFPEIQRGTVGFGGVAAAWQATQRFGIATQIYAQGAYFDSELDEVGGNTVQVAVGGTLRFPDHRLSLSVALVEDVFSDASTDFALHVTVRGHRQSKTGIRR